MLMVRKVTIVDKADERLILMNGVHLDDTQLHLSAATIAADE
jgi:hypothetical protein